MKYSRTATAFIGLARQKSTIVIALFLAVCLSQVAAAQANSRGYKLTDLGVLTSLGDTDSKAYAFSPSGWVVGVYGMYTGGFSRDDAFLWTPTSTNGTTGSI